MKYSELKPGMVMVNTYGDLLDIYSDDSGRGRISLRHASEILENHPSRYLYDSWNGDETYFNESILLTDVFSGDISKIKVGYRDDMINPNTKLFDIQFVFSEPLAYSNPYADNLMELIQTRHLLFVKPTSYIINDILSYTSSIQISTELRRRGLEE